MALVNLGIVARIIAICLQGMGDEEIPVKRRVFTLLKAGIVANVINGLLLVIKSYF